METHNRSRTMELIALLFGWLFGDDQDEHGRNRYWEHPDFDEETDDDDL